MRLYVSVLENGAGSQAKMAVEGLKAAISAGEYILEGMTGIAALDAGIVTTRMSDVRLSALVGEICADFRPQAEARGLRLRTFLAPVSVQTDPSILKELLKHLLGNALKFTERGGVLVAVRRRGTAASIEIWDTGIGIPDEQRETIFQEFYQVQNPERDERGGWASACRWRAGWRG